MAGDWIKMRADLFTHPKVVRIASALKADTLRTVGGLMSVWCLFDAHSEDGRLEGYTPEVLDAHLRWEGFAGAMIDVGWLTLDEAHGLVLPRFDTHNGQSAKRRAQDADRKREVRKASAPEADKTRTREEKRREEKEPNGSLPPAPEGLDLQAWDRWQEYRRQIKKPIKPASAALAMKSLAGYGANQAAVVEQSIANGWQGLFELKGARAQVNRQEAVEQRNRSVAEQWLADAGEAHETV